MLEIKVNAVLKRRAVIASVFCILLSTVSFAWADLGAPIGEIALAKGVATARSDLRDLTSLAKGSPVYSGDILETASRSFLVIKFSDGGKITLRPESRFDIEEYDATPGQEKESFKLLKGGLRAVTGAIGKNKPQQVSFKAKNTTIGIRGTTFVIKICEPGTDGCRASDGGPLSDDEAKEKVDIFVVDKNGGSKQKITRQQLQQILEGVYIAVFDGGVRVGFGQKFVDMNTGDKCMMGGGGAVECFTNGIDLNTADVYLTELIEDITEFNLFDDAEISVGNTICEIN